MACVLCGISLLRSHGFIDPEEGGASSRTFLDFHSTWSRLGRRREVVDNVLFGPYFERLIVEAFQTLVNPLLIHESLCGGQDGRGSGRDGISFVGEIPDRVQHCRKTKGLNVAP